MNLFETKRRHRAALEAQNWTDELHYGALVIVQGAAGGVIIGAALLALWFALDAVKPA